MSTQLSSQVSEWIYRYYIDPIIYDTGYNPVNTITWAIMLGLIILGLIRLFKKLELPMDERLVAYTIPYILAGSSLRVVEDADLLQAPASYLLITPLIYFLVFLVTITALLATRKLLGKEFYRAYAAIGIIWTLLNLAALSTIGISSTLAPVAIISLGTTITALLYLAGLKVPKLSFLQDRYNMMILYAHMLDASSTYVGVDWFGYYEKHVVPTFLIDLTGTAAVMYPLKLIILLPVLSVINGSLEDPSLRNLTKLALITLGLAPAIRNTLRLTLGI
ncbi:MAG TPA: DUF63 family protein [Methanotrichaceae archaeon]|nr:DUF63 family protein [Methanotrichaceae archaeon]